MKRVLIAFIVCCWSSVLLAARSNMGDYTVSWTWDTNAIILGEKDPMNNNIRLPAVRTSEIDKTGDLIIPSSVSDGWVGSFTVGEIGEKAFYQCIGILSAKLPNTIESIDTNAFRGCISLASINLPESVTRIGNGVFCGCRSLTSIAIPPNVYSIESDTFSGCTSLTSIVIPASVREIRSSAFDNCNPRTITLYGSYRFEEVLQKCDTVYFEQAYETEWRTAFAAHTPETKPTKWICLETGEELGIDKERVAVEVFPVDSGEVSFTEKLEVVGEHVLITASAKPGHTFLGWESNVEGIGGISTTLRFTMPNHTVELKAHFAVSAVLDMWKSWQVQDAINEKVTAGELLPKEMVDTKVQEVIDEKLERKELVSVDTIKEIALRAPVIEVAEGKAKVSIELQTTSELGSNTWVKAKGEEATIAEDGILQVKITAEDKAAFYKFVVPVKQK